jgi:hypothetical protein
MKTKITKNILTKQELFEEVENRYNYHNEKPAKCTDTTNNVACKSKKLYLHYLEKYDKNKDSNLFDYFKWLRTQRAEVFNLPKTTIKRRTRIWEVNAKTTLNYLDH